MARVLLNMPLDAVGAPDVAVDELLGDHRADGAAQQHEHHAPMHVHLEDVHAGRARLEVRQHVERQAKSIDRRLRVRPGPSIEI